MSEAEGAARQVQNYAEVHFENLDGDQLMEPQKIFRAISEEYRIALPILNGYVLVNKPQRLSRLMGTEPAIIKLVYGKIGSLHVYHGLTDMTGELVPLKNGDQPDEVAPVQLPAVDDQHHYYVLDDEGLGERIDDVNHYQPNSPTAKTSLVSLTDEEKQKVDRMEHELSEGNNESILNIEDLKSELEKPMTESMSADEQQAQPDDQPARSSASDLQASQPKQPESKQATSEARRPVHLQPQYPTDNQPAAHEPNQPQVDEPQSQQSSEAPATKSQAATAIHQAHQATPITLLAQALGLICQSLEATSDQQEIADLAQSAGQMLTAIRTLTKLNN
ncbi:hypothetical protein KTE19_10520 [Lentilactobacillus sp. IMAU92037]|uniref:hypothetical protein n=1 Tax=Lentilactobacillus TaxID=2767893 RepID=UPI001C2BC182|nr:MULTISPECIES: hypothetical protein [Lentilactobacillus]MBV0931122.1 hypothetical protein [Lentilactobacillus dabitei]MDM7515359.1 hypothetical protein [Lentilactobacillus sp. TOM.63]